VSATPVAIGSLAGVRELASLRRDELHALGEEAGDLARVVDLGVPFGAIWVIGLSDDAEGRVLAAVAAALALDLARPVVELGAFHATHALAARCRRIWPPTIALRRGDDVRAKVRELFRVLESQEMLITLGGARTEVGIRVTVRDDAAHGWAASIDPRTGDPEHLAVGRESGDPYVLDRKTMRVLDEGEAAKAEGAELRREVIERAADLADRAQLALGRPVEIHFAHLRGRLVVLGVHPITVSPAFTEGAYHRVALLSADEGPIAPLAVDAIDRALTQKEAPAGAIEAPRVVRLYARAYRRSDGRSSSPTARSDRAGFESESTVVSVARAAQRAVTAVGDLARPLADVRAFEKHLEHLVAGFDREDLATMDRTALVHALRERHRLTIDALSLLESTRVSSLAAISALEAACGTLPRDCVHALAGIRITRSRRRIEERLTRLARHLVDQLGEVPEPHRVPAAMRPRWQEVKLELAHVRPLGVDVRPVAIGADDRALRAALVRALEVDPDRAESARREAVRRLLATARGRPLGRAREGIAASIAMGLGQLAEVKGRIGEALASALLRLRGAACAIGTQLVDGGILDEADDVLYLDLAEIEEAALGEPGAYASRVRLRREADARWRHYDPPRRLAARAPT
jgi:hypothetical protein